MTVEFVAAVVELVMVAVVAMVSAGVGVMAGRVVVEVLSAGV